MSEQRDERFYVRGNTSFEFFKAFRAALEKMAGHRLADAWYDDEKQKVFYDEIDRRREEGRTNAE